MKKLSKILTVGLIGILHLFSCDTPGNVNPLFRQYFIKYYGEDGNQQGKDFAVNPANDTLIIIGNTSTSTTMSRMFLTITDIEGNVIHQRRLGVNGEMAQDVELIRAGPHAGRYVVLSNVIKNINDSLAIRLTIINTQGDSITSAYYNTLASQQAFSVTTLMDGGYFIAGKTTDTDPTATGNAELMIPDLEDQLVMRVDQSLSVISITRIGASSAGACVKIIEGVPVNYFAGYSDRLVGAEPGTPISNYESNIEMRTFITDPGSGIINVTAGDDILKEELAAVTRTASGIIFALGTQEVSATQQNLYGVLVGSDFGAPPSRGPLLLNGNFEAVSVVPSGARFLIVANKIQPGGNIRDIWLGKISTEFRPEFQVTFGGSFDDRAAAVTELNNGDILVLGTMDVSRQDKIVLIKLNSSGQFE